MATTEAHVDAARRGGAFEEAAERARLEERCADLVAVARQGGADEVEAYGSATRVVSVQWEKAGCKLAQVERGSSFGVRVHRGRRLGFASTNQTGGAALARTAGDALTIAALSPPAEENRLPETGAVTPRATLFRREVADLATERAVELGRGFVDSILASEPRISIDNASFSVWQVAHAVRSTAGARASEADAGVSFSVMGMALGDDGEVGGFHYTGDSLRDLSKLDEALERARAEFVDVALGNLGGGAADSYVGPVVFSPSAFAAVFLQPLLSACSAIAVQRGRSALAGKLGERVGVTGLTVLDDPTDVELAGAGSFDREGVACGRFPIVEAGVLRSYLYNGLAARIDGRASTGHASGGARSIPGLGAHALCVAGGDGGTKAELLARLGRGLYVERFSGTVDPSSGDFSGVAKSSRWVEDGRCVRSVGETLLAGNAFRLLAGSVVLGSVPERQGGSLRAPAVLVDGVSVTAG